MKNSQRHPVPWLIALAIAAAVAALVLPASAQVVLNEVLADPAQDWDGDGLVDYMGDEWIEVCNLGAGAVDLAEYWLRDGLGDLPHLHLGGVLGAGEVKVFYGSEAVAWQIENGAGATGFSLNNGGDTVELLLNHYVDGNLMSLDVVDSVVYADHEADDDRSSGWEPEGGGWVLFDALNPYTGSLEPGGSGCAPTPGAPNLCGGLVSVDRLGFGELKASFR